MLYYILVCIAVPLWAARNVQFMTKPPFLQFNPDVVRDEVSRYKGIGMLLMVLGLLPIDVLHLTIESEFNYDPPLDHTVPKDNEEKRFPQPN